MEGEGCSGLSEYESRSYLQLKDGGKLRVQNDDGTFRCPFCPNRKKQNYLHNELLCHATGVGFSLGRSRSPAESFAHRALAHFLRNDVPLPSKRNDKPPQQGAHFLRNDVPLPSKRNDKPPQQRKPSDVVEHVEENDKMDIDNREMDADVNVAAAADDDQGTPENDRFVYPWTGVLVNLPTKVDRETGKRVGESGSRLRQELSRFNPVHVRPVWNYFGHSGYALVDFTKDWKGFSDAMGFDRHFEAGGFGKKDWVEKGKNSKEMFGWIARAEDFNLDGPAGQQMRKNRELTTVAEVAAGAVRKKETLVVKLEEQIEERERHVEELKVKYSETSESLCTMMDERIKILNKYSEEVLKMRNCANEHSRKIVEENAKLKSDLETKKRQIDALVKHNEIQRRTTDTDHVNLENQMVALRNAAVEQDKANEDVFELLKVQKIEKETALNRLLQLEKQLDVKQKLELEIQQLNDNVQVMTHMTGEEDICLKEKILELNEELKEKIENLEDLDSLNQTLVVKERMAREELQEAHKELVLVLSQMDTSTKSKIQVKMMGELDMRPFETACNQRFLTKDHGLEAAKKWQEVIKNVEWHPFKTVIINEQAQEIIDDEDSKLKELKAEWGVEVHGEVCRALLEMNTCGSKDVVPEIWTKDGEKAALRDAIRFLLDKWKLSRRKCI